MDLLQLRTPSIGATVHLGIQELLLFLNCVRGSEFDRVRGSEFDRGHMGKMRITRNIQSNDVQVSVQRLHHMVIFLGFV